MAQSNNNIRKPNEWIVVGDLHLAVDQIYGFTDCLEDNNQPAGKEYYVTIYMKNGNEHSLMGPRKYIENLAKRLWEIIISEDDQIHHLDVPDD